MNDFLESSTLITKPGTEHGKDYVIFHLCCVWIKDLTREKEREKLEDRLCLDQEFGEGKEKGRGFHDPERLNHLTFLFPFHFS